jgi:hypothetical protein
MSKKADLDIIRRKIKMEKEVKKTELLETACCGLCLNGIDKKTQKICPKFFLKLADMIMYGKQDLEYMQHVVIHLKTKTPIIYENHIKPESKRILEHYISYTFI